MIKEVIMQVRIKPELIPDEIINYIAAGFLQCIRKFIEAGGEDLLNKKIEQMKKEVKNHA